MNCLPNVWENNLLKNNFTLRNKQQQSFKIPLVLSTILLPLKKRALSLLKLNWEMKVRNKLKTYTWFVFLQFNYM